MRSLGWPVAMAALLVFSIGSPVMACPAQGCVQIQQQPPGDGTYYTTVGSGSGEYAIITFGAITTNGSGRTVQTYITIPPEALEEGQAILFRVKLKRFSSAWTYEGTLEDKAVFEVLGISMGQCSGFGISCTGNYQDCPARACSGPSHWCDSTQNCVQESGTCFVDFVTVNNCNCWLDGHNPCPPGPNDAKLFNLRETCPSGSNCIVEVSALSSI